MKASATQFSSVEIESALDRILNSKLFAKAKIQAKLLRFIVATTKSSPDKPPSEYQCGYAVFDNYDANSSVVRTTAVFVREKMAEYYSGDGVNDRILITIPAGAYKAEFRYNTLSPAHVIYARGVYQLEHFQPVFDSFSAPLRSFSSAVAVDPEFATAHAAKAQAELIEALYKRHATPHETYLSQAERSAQQAMRIDKYLVLSYLVMGVIESCRFRWSEAESYFDKALTLSPLEAGRSVWYAAFLMATKREKEALEITRSNLADASGNPLVMTIHALFLYANHQISEADELSWEIVTQHPQFWLGNIVKSLITAACDTKYRWDYPLPIYWWQYAHSLLSPLDKLGDKERQTLPGIKALAMRDLGTSYSQELLDYGLERRDLEMVAAFEAPNDPLQEAVYWTDSQLAIASAGLGKLRRAIHFINDGFEAADPWVAWAHLLPVFDRVKQHSSFVKWRVRMNGELQR